MALKSITDAAPEPLVEVTRGPLVESVHRGHFVAVDGDGRVVARLGSPDVVAYVRSAAKPIQALPLITTGGADSFGVEPHELAVACGSHNGEEMHTRSAASLLAKAGLGPSHLKCGAHEPYGKGAAEALRARGQKPTPLHNNCSGNHAGLLALAAHLGSPPETYDHPDGAAQREVFATVARFTGVPAGELRFGTDGCGIPAFALPLRAIALMHARLAAPPRDFDDALRDACGRVVSAMLAHPELVEGEGELDTEVMRAGAGRLVSKVGAEGIYAAAVLPSERWPAGLGLVCKVEDGDRGDRARPRAAVELLRQLGLLPAELPGPLAELADPVIRNHRGDRVGRYAPAFRLRPGDDA